jgi:ABC-type glycerol-3-phosphate transport system permease component
MGEAFINSLAVAVPATVIPILAAAFAAYAFAWMDFRGREWLFVLFVGLLVVPLQVAFIPLTRLYVNLGVTAATSSRCGSPTPGSGCRWPSTSCATTSGRCRAR